ncbi:MAG: hypothetical protein JXP73_03525 [Deltaproteobacteria bacterium]|jgi:hypothetical protein|nr:hypothetical protein [Deltaproteobacteria bacterium]
MAADEASPANSAEETLAEEAAREARPAAPENAAAALTRASAAYEYGDLNQMVDAARPVTEGLVPATPEQQTRALRLLGIGLFLTDRQAGAETAFKELLRRDPRARLNPTSTRPEVVAFFENLRRQGVRDPRRLIWNFVPPVGQFQNGDNTKGWIILGVGAAGLVAFVTSDLLLRSWQGEGSTFKGREDTAQAMKITNNWISTGVLAATYIYGVFDGLVGYGQPLDDSGVRVSLTAFPQGAGLGFAF